ncbi:MAG: response regulator [Pseudomonadota bacterium]
MTTRVETPPLILAVDDDRTMLMTLEAKLNKHGYRVVTATNGKSASEVIKKLHNKLDAILLDRVMPDVDGLRVVHWLKKQEHLVKPPIIMQTGSDKPEQIKEGLDAGVFYYLTKPIQDEVLKSVVSSAVKESKQTRALNIELGRHKTSFKLMDSAVFHLKTLEEAEGVACFLANCFPDSEAMLPPIAELIINAVEHGNLAITYEDKTKLIEDGSWRRELARRANLPEHKNKVVEVFYKHEGDKYVIRISDQGKGFPWPKYINVDPARALDNHGRGIARANMIFTKLQYNKEGNQVLATLDKSEVTSIDW